MVYDERDVRLPASHRIGEERSSGINRRQRESQNETREPMDGWIWRERLAIRVLGLLDGGGGHFEGCIECERRRR